MILLWSSFKWTLGRSPCHLTYFPLRIWFSLSIYLKALWSLRYWASVPWMSPRILNGSSIWRFLMSVVRIVLISPNPPNNLLNSPDNLISETFPTMVLNSFSNNSSLVWIKLLDCLMTLNPYNLSLAMLFDFSISKLACLIMFAMANLSSKMVLIINSWSVDQLFPKLNNLVYSDSL